MRIKTLILLTVSVIFLGIFIAKYANNYHEEIAGIDTLAVDYRGMVLPIGWNTVFTGCAQVIEYQSADGYPFVRWKGDCVQSENNQLAALINTAFSFASAALVVYGGYGIAQAQRRYKRSLKDHYQNPS